MKGDARELIFQFEIGEKVNYHPVIGGGADGRVYTIRNRADNFGQPVYWLIEKAGFVAEEALSEAVVRQ